VTIAVDIPGRGALRLEHLLLDVNGTLTQRGKLVDGVVERIARLRGALDVRLLSADTFGSLAEVAATLGTEAERVVSGDDKAAVAAALGLERCAAIGNGVNDAALLASVALGIAVIGGEGASGVAVRAADIVCASVVEALDLLLDDRALVATLRS
jgi:soluble P-type ATPase